MYQTTEEFNAAILGDYRSFRARIISGEKEVSDGICSIKLITRSCSGNYIEVGGAIASYAEVEMWNPGFQLNNAEIEINIDLLLGDETYECCPMGVFTVQNPKDNDGVITFTAYDRIYAKMSGAYFSDLNYPADGKIILQEIEEKTGVPIDVSNLPDGILVDERAMSTEKELDDSGNIITNTNYANPFDGYTYREALGYIAMLYGKYAVTDRTGIVVFKWYERADYTVETDRYYDDLVTSESVFAAGTITCQVGETLLTAGEGTTSIQLENPVMTQERLDEIYLQVKDMEFLPAVLSFLGDPRIEVGDIITVNDKKGNAIRLPAMEIVQEFDGGLLSKPQSFGGVEQETSVKGPTAQKLDRVYTDLFLVKELIGNKASFDYVYSIDAEFKNVSADYGAFKILVTDEFAAITGEFETVRSQYAEFETATAERFAAQEAEITTLSGDLASFKTGEFESLKAQHAEFETTTSENFAATNAQIDILTGNFASFETTMTQELITAKGWMLEGSIGNAQISDVSANKLQAGTINTALVTVTGSDGRLQIVDNTIQISDADRVRVQIGKDASDDYSMSVWDASGNLIWDALGATENTIQRPIIRDSMVSDDAAIKALKIDFQSFEAALTDQGVVISGTVVQVGDKYLNVVLSEQTQLISEHGETLSDHAAQISANEQAIELRVTSQVYESDKAAMESSLQTVEAAVEVMEGKIDLKVEQTDIDASIKKMKIGARNLIRNAKTLIFENYYFGTAKIYLLDENGDRLLDENGDYLIA